MLIRFHDDELRSLYTKGNKAAKAYPEGVVRAFVRVVGLIKSACDERELRALKSLHFEKLKGKRAGQHSVRLNDQFRLVLTLVVESDDKVVVLLEIADYH